MPKLIIDEKEIEVNAGTTILSSAMQVGIDIPHLCYHPFLSIVGSCRMCLVEVEKIPKLQTACSTVVTDGMRVWTNNEKVAQARKSNLEFLFINHPPDCPICDQAGECKAQDYYISYGVYERRFKENTIGKRRNVNLGKNIIMNEERCVLCTRCVRFEREIIKSDDLGIFSRGAYSYVSIFPGHKINHNYSGCLVDLCPVGALTDRDFRFSCRVWFLKKINSVCPLCSRGCPIEIHYNLDKNYGRRVFRIKPKEFLICDDGRYGYRFIDENRIEKPLINGSEANWSDVIKNIANSLKGLMEKYLRDRILLIISANLTNEEISFIRKFFIDEMKIKNIEFLKREGKEDNLLVKSDKCANTKGAQEILNKKSSSIEDVIEIIKSKGIKILYLIDEDLNLPDEILSNLDLIILHSSNHNNLEKHSHYVLPTLTYAEKDGTFTNFEGKVQKINKAFDGINLSRSNIEIIKELAKEFGLRL